MNITTKNKKKRPLREFKSLEELVISTPQKFAELHGVITELSDMTETYKYFEGRLADNKASVRIVGFNHKQEKRLSLYRWNPRNQWNSTTALSRNSYTEMIWKL